MKKNTFSKVNTAIAAVFASFTACAQPMPSLDVPETVSTRLVSPFVASEQYTVPQVIGHYEEFHDVQASSPFIDNYNSFLEIIDELAELHEELASVDNPYDKFNNQARRELRDAIKVSTKTHREVKQKVEAIKYKAIGIVASPADIKLLEKITLCIGYIAGYLKDIEVLTCTAPRDYECDDIPKKTAYNQCVNHVKCATTGLVFAEA